MEFMAEYFWSDRICEVRPHPLITIYCDLLRVGLLELDPGKCCSFWVQVRLGNVQWYKEYLE